MLMWPAVVCIYCELQAALNMLSKIAIKDICHTVLYFLSLCRFVILRGRSLYSRRSQRSIEVTRGYLKPEVIVLYCITRMGTWTVCLSYTWYVVAWYLDHVLYCFCRRSKVIWGYQKSSCGKRYISRRVTVRVTYFSCGSLIVRTKYSRAGLGFE